MQEKRNRKSTFLNAVHVDNRYFLQTHNTCFAAELTFYLFTLLRIQFARGHRFAMTIQFTLQDIWYSKSLVGKKYSIFFHNVPTLVGIFIILKDLFEFKKRSQKGRNNKYHLFNGGNIRENFICENITHFLETELILKCMYLTETKIIHMEEAKNLL